MEVASPTSPTDFDFNPSAYASAPSTPRLIGDHFSAPTSPTRITEFYRDFDHLLISDHTHNTNSLATVPFAWEEKPGVPKSNPDFAFDVTEEFYPEEDLFQFHGGLIQQTDQELERGRERNVNTSGMSSSRTRSRRTRSLPPLRDIEQPPAPPHTAAPMTSTCTTLSASGSGKGSKKWSFMDLFLFRSASDGRALDRDPLKKYSAIFRKHDEDFRNASLRDRSRSGSGSGSRRRGRPSAHELHYTVNRAVSNDMKKKTFLPYKQGILGKLAFNPSVHALSNGFGFSHNRE